MSPVSKGVKRRGAERGTDCEVARARGGENEVGGEVEGLARICVPCCAAIMAEKEPALAGGEKPARWKACPCVSVIFVGEAKEIRKGEEGCPTMLR